MNRIIEVEGLGTFSAYENDIVSDWIARGDIWEPWILEYMNSTITPGSTVVDGGAFIGLHTVAMANLVGSDGMVLAFEPNPPTYNLLIESLRLTYGAVPDWVQPLRFGLGATDTSVEILWSRSDNRGSTALVDGIYSVPDAKTVERPVSRVSILRLDSLELDALDFMKLDIEGYELAAILGAEEKIKQFKPAIIFECWRDHGIEATKQDFSNPSLPFNTLLEWGYSIEQLHGPDWLACHE